jgi:hypothetical protein
VRRRIHLALGNASTQTTGMPDGATSPTRLFVSPVTPTLQIETDRGLRRRRSPRPSSRARRSEKPRGWAGRKRHPPGAVQAAEIGATPTDVK